VMGQLDRGVADATEEEAVAEAASGRDVDTGDACRFVGLDVAKETDERMRVCIPAQHGAGDLGLQDQLALLIEVVLADGPVGVDAIVPKIKSAFGALLSVLVGVAFADRVRRQVDAIA
jgi:hypothetical protein